MGRLPLLPTAFAILALLAAACAPTTPGAAPAAGERATDGASVSAPSAAAPGSQLDALIQGARREGRLSFVWGEGTLGGDRTIQRLAANYNKLYGLNVEVRFTPGPSMGTVASKILQEYQAGQPSSTDILLAYPGQIAPVAQANVLEPVDWTAWAPNIQDPALVTDNRMAVTFETAIPGITYSAQRVTGNDVPKTMHDLLEPRYKGRVAMTPYTAHFDFLASDEVWGRARTLEFGRRFADQVAGLIRCNELERILSGEFDLYGITCSQSNTLELKARGSPIDTVVPADAPLVIYIYAAVPRNAPHPNAAKLWVNYLLSREAQDIVYEADYADSHLVPGSRSSPAIDELQRAGVPLHFINLEFFLRQDHAALTAVQEEVKKYMLKQP